MTMGMMGCLGVWVTDALEPEPTNYFQVKYASNDTYTFALWINPIVRDYVDIDWGDGIIKRYVGISGVGGYWVSFERYCRNGDIVKAYDPSSFVDEFTVDGGDEYTNVELLTNVTTLVFSESTAVSFTLPNDMTNIEIFNMLDCSNLTTLTIGSGCTSLAYIETTGSTVITTVNIPDDLPAIEGVFLENCALSEASVNDILVKLDSMAALSLSEIILSGGTSAAPSGAGAAAKASLIIKGVSVSTN